MHAQPGGFLIMVLAGSLVAPLTFMAAVVMGWLRGKRDTAVEDSGPAL